MLFNFICLLLSWLFALPERLVAWNNSHSALGPSISLEKKVTKALRREILFFTVPMTLPPTPVTTECWAGDKHLKNIISFNPHKYPLRWSFIITFILFLRKLIFFRWQRSWMNKKWLSLDMKVGQHDASLSGCSPVRMSEPWTESSFFTSSYRLPFPWSQSFNFSLDSKRSCQQ